LCGKEQTNSLANTHFGAKNVSMGLGYFDVAKSENVIGLSQLALVFEIFYMFFKNVRKFANFDIGIFYILKFDMTLYAFSSMSIQYSFFFDAIW